MVGGLLLTVCSVPYLAAAFGGGWMQRGKLRLVNRLFVDPEVEGQQVVVVARCDTLTSTEGYEPAGVYIGVYMVSSSRGTLTSEGIHLEDQV